MLIEQIIEFDLRGFGPPARKCASITGIGITKQKSSSGLLFTAKILH